MSNETERPEQVISNLKAQLRDAEIMLGTKDLMASQDRARIAELEGTLEAVNTIAHNTTDLVYMRRLVIDATKD